MDDRFGGDLTLFIFATLAAPFCPLKVLLFGLSPTYVLWHLVSLSVTTLIFCFMIAGMCFFPALVYLPYAT